MAKQLKIFVYSLLTLLTLAVFSSVISSQNNQQGSNFCGENCCQQQQVIVVQKNEVKEVHLVYDFAKGTVSTVRIRKDYQEPDIAVQTKRLGP